MIAGLPDLNGLLTPVLTWATTAVATIAAIILVWNIYEEWTRNPERFSWFAALFKALGVGLIAAIALNAPTIIAAFTAGGGAAPTP
jgi:alkylhydroperoxidase family enzyme